MEVNIKFDSMENEPTKLEKTVIDNIRRIRMKKGISQFKLSIFCETSASYIGLMETYKNIPKLSTIERIAQALNVPPLELFKPADETAENNEYTKEDAQKQKLREKVKNEILKTLGDNLDGILQMI